MRSTHGDGHRRLLLIALALAVLLVAGAAACGGDDDEGDEAAGGTTAEASDEQYTIGVSNTLLGNGWREEMICSVKAEALASGKVDQVLVHNINGGAAEQIAGIRNLISSGADAIIINPADRNALNSVIKEADSRDIVVVAVDQAVSAPEAYIATNDQVAYGRLGMEWLAEQLGGKGNVVEMRGIAGVPADTDRHRGVLQALEKYPDVKVVKQTFTGWQFAPGAKQMRDILNSGVKVDGVWTSGIDYVVVNAFKTAGQPYVPIVGADNNEFIRQVRDLEGFDGAAVTNPATIGGVGVDIALKVLDGETVERETLLTPEVWTKAESDTIDEFYDPQLPPTYSSQMIVEPYHDYSKEQLTSCQGP
jgi:ribose transport system substrate-binding protein